MNGRPLRVDYAENEKANIATGGPGTFQQAQPPPQSDPRSQDPWWRRDQPGGVNPPGTLPIRDGTNRVFDGPSHIANAVQTMPHPQIYDIMTRMKTLVQSNPDHARQILIANPPLATGLLHAQIVIGMIAPAVVQKIIAHATTKQQSGPQQPPQPLGALVPPVQPTQTTPSITPYPLPVTSNTTIPMGGPPGGGVGSTSASGSGVGLSGVNGGGGVATSSGEDGLGGGLNFAAPSAEQKALLQQVINLTPQQIEKLPAQQRQQVMQLKQYWMGQNVFNVSK